VENIDRPTMTGPGQVREEDGTGISGEVEDFAVDGDQKTESANIKMWEVSSRQSMCDVKM
jgi:hypothetical protein